MKVNIPFILVWFVFVAWHIYQALRKILDFFNVICLVTKQICQALLEMLLVKMVIPINLLLDL